MIYDSLNNLCSSSGRERWIRKPAPRLFAPLGNVASEDDRDSIARLTTHIEQSVPRREIDKAVARLANPSSEIFICSDGKKRARSCERIPDKGQWILFLGKPAVADDSWERCGKKAQILSEVIEYDGKQFVRTGEKRGWKDGEVVLHLGIPVRANHTTITGSGEILRLLA